MHKLMEYVCDEMDTLEKKVEKGEDLSAKEIEYLGELTDIKKDLLEIEDADGGSYAMRSSYAGNGRGRSPVTRDRYGRYSGEGYSRNYSMGDHSYDGVMDHLEKMMRDEPNEHKRREIEKFIDKMERM